MQRCLVGKPVLVANSYKSRVKTHKNKIIDWFYEKIYGYEEKSFLYDNQVVVLKDYIMVSNEETCRKLFESNDFEKICEEIKEIGKLYN